MATPEERLAALEAQMANVIQQGQQLRQDHNALDTKVTNGFGTAKAARQALVDKIKGTLRSMRRYMRLNRKMAGRRLP